MFFPRSKHQNPKNPVLNLGSLVYGGTAGPQTVLDWMYQDSDASIRLDRKYDFAQVAGQICEMPPSQRDIAMETYRNSQRWKDLNVCNRPPSRCAHLREQSVNNTSA